MSFKTVVSSPSAPSTVNAVEVLMTNLKSPQGIFLIFLFVVVALASRETKSKGGKLGTSYWATPSDRARLKSKGKGQVAAPRHNSCSYYLGTPKEISERLLEYWLLRDIKNPTCPATEKVLYLPEAQRGTLIWGAAGTGKTVSAIDPAVRSMVDQGFPLVLYDFKFPNQTQRIAAYALKRGYDLKFFCPGFPLTDTCNPIDFLRDAEDGVGASQLAETIIKNIETDPNASGDKFFDNAGATLVQGIFLLTKAIGDRCGSQYADLVTASLILSLPNLAKRLGKIRDQGTFSRWTMAPLSQIISLAGSEETEASVVGTAQKVFNKFLQKDYIQAYCGNSTLNLDLSGKQILFMGVDRQNRDVVIPLMASILHMVVSRNISRSEPRSDPFVLSIDELPTIYLPQLAEWLAQNREDGLCALLAIQNFSQLEQRYGKEVASNIFANCSTKIIFNPQEIDSAEKMAKMLGGNDIDYSAKSRSKNFGSKGGGGGSRSESDHKHRRDLFELAQFMKLPTGEGVVISPACGVQENYVPFKHKFYLFAGDQKQMQESIDLWPKLADAFSKRQSTPDWQNYFNERQSIVNSLFVLE
jgi:type IV secretory pathway TraG/TraD family ATPase VirD4